MSSLFNPVSAIGLALLTCSTRVHCNPDKHIILVERKPNDDTLDSSKAAEKVDKGPTVEVLAPETQALLSPTPARAIQNNSRGNE